MRKAARKLLGRRGWDLVLTVVAVVVGKLLNRL
jgi:hypothetical protein